MVVSSLPHKAGQVATTDCKVFLSPANQIMKPNHQNYKTF